MTHGSRRRTLARLIKNVNVTDRGLWLPFAVYTLAAGIAPLLAVLLPKLLIAQLELGAGASAVAILGIAGGFLVLYGGCNALSRLLHGKCYTRLTHLRMGYVHATSQKLLSMAYKNTEDARFFEEHQNAWQATWNNDTGVEGLYHRSFESPARLLTAAALAVTIGMLSPWILLAMAANAAAAVVAARGAHRYAYRRRAELNRMERKLSYFRTTASDFSYGKDIRLYGLKARVSANFDAALSGYRAVLSRFRDRELLWGLLPLLVMLAADMLTYGTLIARTARGALSIADFSMYLAAAASLSALLKQLAEDGSFILNEGQYATDMFAFLDEGLGYPDGRRKRIEGDTLSVEFRDVSFRYPNTDRWVIRHLDLKLEKGERLALVGVNGAGKSTLVKLMTGLFDADEGEILINGIPAREFERRELFAMFSVVFQEVNLLAFSVAQNVSGSAAHTDTKRVRDVLSRVGLLERMESLPRGLDHPVLKVIEADGAEFSGGESQKLAVARALYKDAAMVVMDEPTSALDALAEAEIYENFSSLVAGKTAVYISHRLASTKFCDRIVLLGEEGVRECGSHEELMRARGEYFRMFTVQGKYYREEEEV